MLAIAGQTVGPIWLKFFKGTDSYPGVTKAQKLYFFKKKKILHGQRRALLFYIIGIILEEGGS